MSKESKLYLLRDRKDYIKKLTNDDVINIIGTKGSGKTKSTLKYINDDDYIVINCDRLYDMPTDNVVEDKYLIEIKDMLKKKCGKACEGEEFIDEINPKYSIISVGKNNRDGHPNDRVLDNLEDSKIYRTDQDGSVMFKIKNNKLKVDTCSPKEGE